MKNYRVEIYDSQAKPILRAEEVVVVSGESLEAATDEAEKLDLTRRPVSYLVLTKLMETD